jgi:hypothetical protein
MWTFESAAPWRISILASLVLLSVPLLWSQDDNENTTPTAWWIHSGQSVTDINNTINSLRARIINIKADTSSNTYTVTYVQNSGAYAKGWWWYVGIDAPTLAQNLQANNARLISLQAYDIGGGSIRFAVSMIANTGADAKTWWYYYGASANDITTLTQQNNARLTTLESYSSNGQTLYAFIMIANTGPDANGWWWYVDQGPQNIGSELSANNARLLDITYAGNGNFNAVMESCSNGCSSWWWWFGYDIYGIVDKAQDYGARVVAADTFDCGGPSPCLVATMIANSPADITSCDPQGCISEATLASNICNKLANNVVGYACLVGGMAPIFGGLARTDVNPPSLPMAPDLVTNIASVSKTMTTTAILQLLTTNGIDIHTKISPYMYPDWPQGQNIAQLTFEHLLTHTSGFGQLPGNACGNGNTYSALETIVAGGVSASDIGHPQYGNCNFSLLRELMPALLGVSLTGYPDGPARAEQSSSLYINYMNSHVFQPVGIPPSQCAPPLGNYDILSYPFPAGNVSGTDWGDDTLQCGAGGWVLSADQIFRVVSDLATGNTLLTNTQKQQMFSDCLGWDCSVRNDCPVPYVCKNGALFNGVGTWVFTYAGILKCNVPVVVVVNSPLPPPYQGGEDIIGLVKDSLATAAVPGTPMACPSSIPFTIFGQITVGGSGLSGVTVNMSGGQSASTTTDESGNYSFAGLAPGGSYTVTPARYGYSFSPPYQTFTNLGADLTANFTGISNAIAVHPGDFDGNGTPDLVWWNNQTGQATVHYYGGESGVADIGWNRLTSSGYPGWRVVGVADFDGNGVPDLVWMNDATRQVTVHYYGGSGGATELGWNWLAENGFPGWRVVAVGDFDRNGIPDLVWMNDDTGQVTVHYYGGAGGATDTGWRWLTETGFPGWTVAAAADFDGNGVPDLVWQKDSTGQVAVQYFGGQGGGTDIGWNWLNETGVPGWTVVGAVDIDGNGVPDLIWQNNFTAQVTVNYYGGPGGAYYLGWAWLASSGFPGWTSIAP